MARARARAAQRTPHARPRGLSLGARAPRREHPALTGFIASISLNNEPSLALVRGLGAAKVGEYDDPEDGLEHVYALHEAGAVR